MRLNIVFATAKILIRKQFTTVQHDIMEEEDCFCHCKDTNSKAIHNACVVCPQLVGIVFATAKILIRKQFTTSIDRRPDKARLFLPLQRY